MGGWTLLGFGTTTVKQELTCESEDGCWAATAVNSCRMFCGHNLLCALCLLFCLTLIITLSSFVLLPLLYSWRISGSEMLWKLSKVQSGMMKMAPGISIPVCVFFLLWDTASKKVNRNEQRNRVMSNCDREEFAEVLESVARPSYWAGGPASEKSWYKTQ